VINLQTSFHQTNSQRNIR